MSYDLMQFLKKTEKGEYYFDDKFMFVKQGSDIVKLALFEGNYYKLRVFNGVPILEIDGLRMHLVKEFKTPLDYSKEVVKKLRVHERDSVLDTCLGLGYTAIEAAHHGAKVTACEISSAVIKLAQWNPWSAGLFEEGNIKLIRGDITEKIRYMADRSFDGVIHDPPRFSKAGQLYSLQFYLELFRVLKNGGRLFHYVGSVGKGKGRKLDVEVEKRLRQAGFANVRFDPRLQGLFSIKVAE